MKKGLDSVKFQAKQLCNYIPIEPIANLPICNHPFTDNVVDFSAYLEEKGVNIEEYTLTSEVGYKKWRNKLFRIIDNCEDIETVFHLVRDPYKMVFLKLIKSHILNSAFSYLLGYAWTTQDNPNDDINVPVEESVEWFESAKKSSIMDRSEIRHYNTLPEEFIVYRGVAYNRTKYGLSWTEDRDKAIWFANRFEPENNEPIYLLEVKIKKEQVLCYFDRRGEKDIVINPFKIKKKIKQTIL